MSASSIRLIELSCHIDARGSLSFLEGSRHVPFDIKRVFYLYDVKEGQKRGAHAHRVLEQVFIAVAGAFDISLDDGAEIRTVHLSTPARALYVPPLVWCDLERFTTGAVCLALASHPFDEADYLRSYDQFLAAVKGPDR
jgi:WxcM-like, C-terminal